MPGLAGSGERRVRSSHRLPPPGATADGNSRLGLAGSTRPLPSHSDRRGPTDHSIPSRRQGHLPPAATDEAQLTTQPRRAVKIPTSPTFRQALMGVPIGVAVTRWRGTAAWWSARDHHVVEGRAGGEWLVCMTYAPLPGRSLRSSAPSYMSKLMMTRSTVGVPRYAMATSHGPQRRS